MSNILDYVSNNAGVTINEMPFNELDGLVLSALAYIDWKNLVPGIDENGTISLHDVILDLTENHKDRYERLPNNERKLLQCLMNSERYSSIQMGNYDAQFTHREEVDSPEMVEQFAALTFTYDDSSTDAAQNFIAYRGTDSTLEGWQEDFNMAFDLHTESQKDARDYINAVALKLDGDLRPGGHSKGGNNAMYAYLYCDKAVRERVVKIYSYDGPGFLDERALNEHYSKMIELLDGTAIAPYDSIIGLLLKEGKHVFVNTDAGMLMDHDLYTWQVDVENNSFELREQSENSKLVNDLLDRFVRLLPPEVRKKMINALFNYIYAGDFDNFNDVIEFFQTSDLLDVVCDIWNNASKTDKEGLFLGFLAVIAAASSVCFDIVSKKVDEWINDCIDAIDRYVDEVIGKITKVVDWATEKMSAFITAIRDSASRIKEALRDWCNQNLNQGYKYADSNPQITLNSFKLRAYADDLRSIINRANNLDSRMDSLYWSVGLAGVFSLLQANILIKGTWRIKECAAYLLDTARDFEAAEVRLSSKI